jgi:hypothetical protein
VDIVELEVHDVFDAVAKIAVCGGKGRCRTPKKQRGGCACGAVNYPVHLDVLRVWEWNSFGTQHDAIRGGADGRKPSDELLPSEGSFVADF